MGQPKAWLHFGREFLLQRVVRRLGMVADQMVVVAAQGQELPDLPEQVKIVLDSAFGQGPLRGLATGLSALPDSVDLVAVAATDAPFLQPAWYEALASQVGQADLVVPRDRRGRFHPLAAVYRRGPTLAAAEELLGMGLLRMTGLLEALAGRVIDPNELVALKTNDLALWNLNTPEDYHQALLHAGLTDTEF